MSPFQKNVVRSFQKHRGLELISRECPTRSVILETSWLYIGKIVIRGVDKNPFLLLRFRGVERYSVIEVVGQFRWPKMTQMLTECSENSSGIDLTNKKLAIKLWIHR